MESCPCVCKACLLQNWSLQMSTRSSKPFLRFGDQHINLKLLSSMIIFRSSFLSRALTLMPQVLSCNTHFGLFSLQTLHCTPQMQFNHFLSSSNILAHTSFMLSSKIKVLWNHTWGPQETKTQTKQVGPLKWVQIWI